MIKSLALTTSALFAIGTVGAQAGGFELSPLSTAFMYEDGGYAEIGYSSRKYTVTDDFYAPTSSAVQDQSNTSLAFKVDLNDAFSVGLSRYRQGSIQLDYSGSGSVVAANLPVVDLDIDALAILARYEVNENFSVLGGLKRTTVKDAIANIFQSASLPQSNITGTSELGYVYGLAYQRDDIALRVELTAETATDFELATSNGNPVMDGTTTGSVPDYLNLAFQSGIAKDTLVFGSIRKANWASNQITVAPQQMLIPGTTTSTFSDTTTYNIGVGRKINDDVSVFASYSTESGGEGNETSLLNVTNGYEGISIGMAYSLDNTTITVGGNYTNLGDVNMGAQGGGALPPSSFSGNTVKSVGLKVAYNF